jgi:transcriptional regulator with XRE-family HTH domain
MKATDFRKARRKMGLTQAGLARALGVSRAAVSRWESGKRSIDSVLALAMDCLAERMAKKGRLKNGE